MADLSNKELLIPLGTFIDMEKRVKNFQTKENKNPAIVYINGVNKKDHVTYSRFLDMKKRIIEFKKDNSKQVLNNVWIKKPKATVNVLKAPTIVEVIPTVNIKGKNYNLKNFTEFYMLIGGFGYSYYYNDILTLQEEIHALTYGKAMNCTDFSQLGVYIASQFKKDNKLVYQTRYRHVNCKSGGGHVQFEITGGEFKNWTVVDLAAKADKNSRVYPLGDGWCMDGKVRGYNESWILLNNGKHR